MILIFALGSSEDQYSDLEWSDSLVIRQIQIQEYILENLVLKLKRQKLDKHKLIGKDCKLIYSYFRIRMEILFRA